MRRDELIGVEPLSDACRLDIRLADGRLPADAIRRIAEALVRFHAQAPARSELARLAVPEAVQRRVEKVLADLRRVEPALGSALLDRIAEGQHAKLASLSERMHARVAANRVCAGHTDLRCEHVRIDDAGSVALLDPVGRGRSPCAVDVCDDLTLLSVDLAGRGRVDLAERLLAAYAGAADDYDLYAVADFYERHHACERAYSAARRALAAGTPSAVRERAQSKARRYAELALSTYRPPLLPRALVIMGGLMASGKSTVSAALADNMAVPRIVADTTRASLLERATGELDDETYLLRCMDRHFDDCVYAKAFRQAGCVLSSGRGVIVDACFPTAATRRAASELAERLAIPLFFIECKIDWETTRARLIARSGKGGVQLEEWFELYDFLAAKYEPPRAEEAGTHLIVDTARPLSETLAELREKVPTWPSGLAE